MNQEIEMEHLEASGIRQQRAEEKYKGKSIS
jgi:hypothetical protein